tara:strand:+ start:282 stop:929 length:648 start_codon:yes stop_codon:yes gene_type:complete
MGTLKVDNIQKRDGTALITDGAASTSLLTETALRNAGIGAILLTDTTISNGATSVVFGPLTTYDKYVVDFIDVNHSTDGGAVLRARFGTDASTFNTTSNYSTAVEVLVFDDASAVDARNSASQIDMTYDSNNQWGGANNQDALEGQAMLFGKQRSTANAYPSILWQLRGSHSTANGATHFGGAGYLKVSGTFTHIQFYLSTGNFTRGKMKLYGVS